jgi:hypothetical protein
VWADLALVVVESFVKGLGLDSVGASAELGSDFARSEKVVVRAW